MSHETYRPRIRARYHFLDVVQLWIENPLPKEVLLEIKQHCGNDERTKHPRVWPHPMKFQPKWQQRIRLFQPSEIALDILKRSIRGDYLINYVEIALDLITPNPSEALHLSRYLIDHLVQRWHGGLRVNVVGSGLYWSEDRTVRNQFVFYADRASKESGELDCVHLERRTFHASAVRSLGIHGISDLVRLDHRKFWAKHLTLYDLDFAKLGRIILGTTRRTDHVVQYSSEELNVDARVGELEIRLHPERNPALPTTCTQDVIDCLHKTVPLRRALRRIPNRVLLG